MAAMATISMQKKVRLKAELGELKKAFLEADKNKNGVISLEEYKAILKKKAIYTNDRQVEKIFSLADKNHDKQLDMEEFFSEMDIINKNETAFKNRERDKVKPIRSVSQEQILPPIAAAGTRAKKSLLSVSRSEDDVHQDKDLNRIEFQSMLNQGRLRGNQNNYISMDEMENGREANKDKTKLTIRKKKGNKFMEGSIERPKTSRNK